MATTATTDNLPPPRLLSGYGGGKLWLWIVVAFAIHAVIIGATSVNYLRDFLDPQGAEARHAAELAKAVPAAGAKPGTPTGAAPGAAATGAGGAGGAATTQKSASTSASATKPNSDKTAMEDKKSTPMIKALNDTAKPGEAPKKPDDLGIGLEETNPK